MTFTRRACEEMRERLDALLGELSAGLTVATFHRLGLDILREQGDDIAVADETRRIAILRDLLPDATTTELRRAMTAVSAAKRAAAARFAADPD
ncbi:MAG TPA: UvrD-helicase domain-containing protein, partial [Pseudonocardiaceae bacterium]